MRILNYKRNGTPFWNMFTLAPMKDSDGTIRFLVGVQVRLQQLHGPNYELANTIAATCQNLLPPTPTHCVGP